ncbi:SUMF1/EgtB/PvdO family nonheme iron enzyme [Undibacterium sp. Rencai35W]|uniref:SUMF1/EgtB/PvdO family nonheme iron enzyme n=1 Tax=Undibacterium sp. Rencai35W TaxID=3413046 RepID=UPI003BF05C9F
MKVELIQERAFTVRTGTKAIHGLFHVSEWEGLNKYQDNAGRTLILNDGQIVKGSPELLASLTDVPAGFVQVPETKLPNGLVVPTFKVAQHVSGKDEDGNLLLDGTCKPWTNISFFDAQKACEEYEYGFITETQWLAIAYDLSQQDCNWTGGKVGEGYIFQGIRNGVGAKSGDYVPTDSTERRWMTLSNGSKICDMNGNVFQWIFDDVQGNDKGVIAKAFEAHSPSLTTAGYPSETKGVGYRPGAGNNWSGNALIRGGCWVSVGNAGVFYLDRGLPGSGNGCIGFRCTLP